MEVVYCRGRWRRVGSFARFGVFAAISTEGTREEVTRGVDMRFVRTLRYTTVGRVCCECEECCGAGCLG